MNNDQHADIELTGTLHPATILFAFLDLVKRFMTLIVIAIVFALLRRNGGVGFAEWAVVAVSVFGIFGAIIKLATTRYGIYRDNFYFRTGLLQKSFRTIPIDRIQTVQETQNFLMRPFNVVTLKIETAVGGSAEATLEVVSVPVAKELKRDLMARKAALLGSAPPVIAENPEEIVEELPPAIYEASTKELVIYGATSNRAALVVAAILAPLAYFQQFFDPRDTMWLYERAENVVSAVRPGYDMMLARWAQITIAIAGILFAVLLIGWLISILHSVVTYYNFILRKTEDSLQRFYGLFTRVESFVPLPRIQAVTIVAPLFRRWFGLCTVQADTAGFVLDATKDSTNMVCPITKIDKTPEFLKNIFPNLDLTSFVWNSVHPRVVFRSTMIGSIKGLLLLALLGIRPYGFDNLQYDPSVFYYSPLVVLLVWLAARASYRRAGFAWSSKFVAIRSGVMVNTVTVLPVGKVQSISVTQSFIQRRWGMADLRVQYAGRSAVSAATLDNMRVEDALRLQSELSASTAASGVWLLDGV
ncbi:MAG: PH domain-containing protein [Fimbriimonadaceae bacterium]